MLIGLAGWMGSGKDSVGNILTRHHGYVRMAFADPLKKSLEILDPIISSVVYRSEDDRGEEDAALSCSVRLSDLLREMTWDQAKQIPEVRRLLQVMGTEVARNTFGSTCWVDLLKDNLRRLRVSDPPVRNVVVTDVRFMNELMTLQSIGGRVFWVHRPGVSSPRTHASERDLDPRGSYFDGTILNHGTLEDLHRVVRRILGEPVVEGLGERRLEQSL